MRAVRGISRRKLSLRTSKIPFFSKNCRKLPKNSRKFIKTYHLFWSFLGQHPCVALHTKVTQEFFNNVSKLHNNSTKLHFFSKKPPIFLKNDTFSEKYSFSPKTTSLYYVRNTPGDPNIPKTTIFPILCSSPPYSCFPYPRIAALTSQLHYNNCFSIIFRST